MSSVDLLHAGLGWPIVSILLAVGFLSSMITAGFGSGGTIMPATRASPSPPPALPGSRACAARLERRTAAILRAHLDKSVMQGGRSCVASTKTDFCLVLSAILAPLAVRPIYVGADGTLGRLTA